MLNTQHRYFNPRLRLLRSPRLGRWAMVLLALSLFAVPILICMQHNSVVSIPSVAATRDYGPLHFP